MTAYQSDLSVRKLKELSIPRVPLADEIPWLMQCAPGVVLCKDGSLLAGFEYSGIDVDNIDESKLSITLRDLESAMTQLDEKYILWWVIDKRKDYAYEKSQFKLRAAKNIDGLVQKEIDDGGMFSLSYKLFILYTGETGVFKYMDNVQRLLNEENMSWPKALVKAAAPHEMTRQGAIHDARQLDQNIGMLEEGINRFLGRMIHMSFTRLMGWDLDTALVHMPNIGIDADAKFQAPPSTLLDTWGAISEVHVGREVIAVGGPNRTVYAAQLALQEYPKHLAPGIFEKLFSLDAELRLTHVVRCLSQPAARSLLNESAEYYKFAQASLVSRLVAYLTSKPAAVDQGKHEQYLQCVEALRRQTTENLGWVRHAVTITAIEGSVEKLEGRVRDITRTLNDFALIRERLNLNNSFLGCIPGAWQFQHRLGMINTEALADCSPIFTADAGNQTCKYLSKEVYHRPVPALAVFRNMYGGRVNFDPLATGLGHTLMVAPSGCGKTTFVNFCLSQFGRYENSRVLVLDRDLSCRITTELHGGKHIDLKSNKVRFAPMAAIGHGPQGMLWAREFVLRIIEEGGYASTATDRNALDKAINSLAKSKQQLTLSNLAVLLSPEIAEYLVEWTKGGVFAMFDHVEDDLSFPDWTCIEMKEIMKIERLSRAFMDHCLYTLERQLDGSPTFIYIEEASFLLASPIFAPILADWLKTLRKKNVMVWMTVQSPESLSSLKDESIRATMADNIPNLLLGYNPKLEQHREVYKDLLGMSHEHINEIKSIVPKRDFIWNHNGNSRVMTTSFSPEILAYLRSDISMQKLYQHAVDTYKADWKAWFVAEATRRSM